MEENDRKEANFVNCDFFKRSGWLKMFSGMNFHEASNR